MRELICSDCRKKLTPIDVLSAREMQIVNLASKGHLMKEIARQLLLSPKTISSHKMRIRRKLGIKSAVEWFTLLKSVEPAQVGHGG